MAMIKRKLALIMGIILFLFPMSAMGETLQESMYPDIDLTAALNQIPVVYVYGESLASWGGKTDIREATMDFEDPVTGNSFTEVITIRPQGTSSLEYPKKNFTIEGQSGDIEVNPDWGYQTEYCLKANYVDPTHASNVVSARLAAQCYELFGLHEDLPNRGAVDGFPVWLVLNGIPQGLYTWNIPKAEWMFGMDEDDENHIVMACEAHTEGAYFLQDYYIPDEEWSIEVGPENSNTIVRFERLVDFISTSSDEEFINNFDQYLNLEACLIYYCFVCISDAPDNVSKNMLMATWDGEVWYPMLYDLDSLWGIKYDGKEVWPERIDEVLNTGHRLHERLRQCFGQELKDCYAALRNGPLSLENIWAEFEGFEQGIPREMLEWDHEMWNSYGARIRTYELMDEMIQQYLPAADAAFDYTADSYSRP